MLLNGFPVKKYSHRIPDLFTKARSFAGELMPEYLVIPNQVKIFSECKADLWGDSGTEKFIAHIYANGEPSVRYDYFGIKGEFADLFKLDQTVFALRNIAIDLNEAVGNSKPELTFRDYIQKFPDKQLRCYAEHLIERGKACSSVFNAARENNFPFAPTFEHRDLTLSSHWTVSSLEILFENNISDAHELRRWLKENIMISKNDLERLEKH